MGNLKTKNRYQILIHKYKERREVYRQKYGFQNGTKAHPEYLLAVANINRKIAIWSKQIRRINKTEATLHWLNDHLIEFIGVSVHKKNKERDTKIVLAKRLFCKYVLENGINSRQAMFFLGTNRSGTIADHRKRFTRSFEFNKENRELWYRFKNYINQSQLKIAA